MKIGIFDSGYGGLTVLEKIVEHLPQYDYIYLGDNARTPYGTRSFEIVYDFTLQCVKKLFELDCQIVILACNTASAKALRTIQQNDLQHIAPTRRVLGVIRPTAERIGEFTETNVVGLFGTAGTIQSKSYELEIAKTFPKISVIAEPCQMWVPLIENNFHHTDGADFFVKYHIDNILQKNKNIDAIILGCTHYPLLLDKIRKYLPEKIKIITQGNITAESFADYLLRHPEHEKLCSKNGTIEFYTTELPEKFNSSATIFLQKNIEAKKINP